MILFAYHLRKHEKADRFKYSILNGHIKPAILYEVILANYWDHSSHTMCFDVNKPFMLVDKQYRSLAYSLQAQNEGVFLKTFEELKNQSESLEERYCNMVYFRLGAHGGLELLNVN